MDTFSFAVECHCELNHLHINDSTNVTQSFYVGLFKDIPSFEFNLFLENNLFMG